MALIFPASPTAGQKYPPDPGTPGVTQYQWDAVVGVWNAVANFVRTNNTAAYNSYVWPNTKAPHTWLPNHGQSRGRCTFLGNPWWTIHLYRRHFIWLQRHNRYFPAHTRRHQLYSRPTHKYHHCSRRYRSNSGHVLHYQLVRPHHLRASTCYRRGIRGDFQPQLLRVKPYTLVSKLLGALWLLMLLNI